MDEPVRSRHRPTHPSGLTSPNPVTTPHGPLGHPPQPLRPAKITHTPGRAARPPCPHSPGQTPRAQTGPEMIYLNSRGGSRLRSSSPTAMVAVGRLFSFFILSVPFQKPSVMRDCG